MLSMSSLKCLSGNTFPMSAERVCLSVCVHVHLNSLCDGAFTHVVKINDVPKMPEFVHFECFFCICSFVT